jgi:hypothetical protein
MSKITRRDTSPRASLVNTGRVAATSAFLAAVAPRLQAGKDNTIRVDLRGVQTLGLLVVAIHAGQTEEETLKQWTEKNKPPFPTGRVTGDLERIRFEWGTVSLPYPILTDGKHIVIAEGLGLLGELDKRIEAMAARPSDDRR